MKKPTKRKPILATDPLSGMIVIALCLLMLIPPEAITAAVTPPTPSYTGETSPTGLQLSLPAAQIETPPENPSAEPMPVDSLGDKAAYLEAEVLLPVDTTRTEVSDPKSPYGLDGKIKFNPSPERAVWLSALFPGLGQIYNRRYWKLPIIVGGFMGLGYATSWNNNQLRDYSQAYRDLLDSDPSTNSYMNFFPSNTDESSLDKSWLQSTLRSRRNYYRRNRDLCIIFVVALYLLCMVDAYVDAQMAHFDISPNLSMDLAPTMLTSPGSNRPALGLNWAFNF